MKWLFFFVLLGFTGVQAHVKDAALSFMQDEERILKFSQDEFDLGEIILGQKKSFTVEVTNLTDKEVRLSPSTGCSKNFEFVPGTFVKSILPHESVKMKLQLKEKVYPSEEGTHSEFCTFYFDGMKDLRKRESFKIHYTLVLNAGKLETTRIQLDTINEFDTVLVKFPLKNIGLQTIEIDVWDYYQSENIQVITPLPMRIAVGKEKQLLFYYIAKDVWHDRMEKIVLKTNRPKGVNSENLIFDVYVRSDSFPRIEFDTTIQYLYTEQAGNGNVIYHYQNTGNRDLVVHTVKTGCGCMVPNYSTEPVKPGEFGKINLKYDTHRIGPFSKSISVYTNVRQTPFTLRVKGEVKRKP